MYDLDTLKAGVTIENILDDFGIAHRHHRAACPVHRGDNRSAFSFNDEAFYCHTQGCKGGVIDLVMALAGTDFRGALDYLARKKGIANDFGITGTTQFTRSLPDNSDPFREERKRLSPKDYVELLCMADDLNRAESDLAECRSNIGTLTAQLSQLIHLKRRKQIAKSLYYLNTQKIDDNRLALFDEQEAQLNYKVKEIKRQISEFRKKVRQ